MGSGSSVGEGPVALCTMRRGPPRSDTNASPDGRRQIENGCFRPFATTTTRILCCSAVSNVYELSVIDTGAMPIFCGCCVQDAVGTTSAPATHAPHIHLLRDSVIGRDPHCRS